MLQPPGDQTPADVCESRLDCAISGHTDGQVTARETAISQPEQDLTPPLIEPANRWHPDTLWLYLHVALVGTSILFSSTTSWFNAVLWTLALISVLWKHRTFHVATGGVLLLVSHTYSNRLPLPRIVLTPGAIRWQYRYPARPPSLEEGHIYPERHLADHLNSIWANSTHDEIDPATLAREDWSQDLLYAAGLGRIRIGMLIPGLAAGAGIVAAATWLNQPILLLVLALLVATLVARGRDRFVVTPQGLWLVRGTTLTGIPHSQLLSLEGAVWESCVLRTSHPDFPTIKLPAASASAVIHSLTFAFGERKRTVTADSQP